MGIFRLILSDKFIWLLLGATLLANVWPVPKAAAASAQTASSAGIFLIFLLHGIKLERHEVVAGLRNWKLQGAIFGYIFGAMMVAGIALSWFTAPWIPADLALGFLFLAILPTTVQSATSYTAIAHGNVAAAVIASALNNIAGIVIAPLGFALLASASGVEIHGDAAIRIATILLLPFIIGQGIQRWARPWILRHPALVGWTDRLVIAFAVYVAFSGAIAAGLWDRVDLADFGVIAMALAVLLTFAFGGAWTVGGLLNFPRDDRKTMLFAGAHKSIAIGAPLAAILFPPERAGLVLLPLLLYHLAQLMTSAPLALMLAKDRAVPGPDAPTARAANR